jgi:hypothetical protein
MRTAFAMDRFANQISITETSKNQAEATLQRAEATLRRVEGRRGVALIVFFVAPHTCIHDYAILTTCMHACKMTHTSPKCNYTYIHVCVYMYV